MSEGLVQQCFKRLQDLRQVSGTHLESVAREAFKTC